MVDGPPDGRGVTTYLGFRRDQITDDDVEIMRLAARAEWEGQSRTTSRGGSQSRESPCRTTGSAGSMAGDENISAARRGDYRPEGAETGTSVFATLKRTVQEFSEDSLTDWAAALTYYGLLSLFPALIALVSVLGIFGDPVKTTQTITDVVTQIGPDTARTRSPARSS